MNAPGMAWDGQHEINYGNDHECVAEVIYNEADAARIVACVNAMAGIEDPAAFVEQAKDSGFWGRAAARNGQKLADTEAELATLKAQQDELLEASKEVLEQFEHWEGSGGGGMKDDARIIKKLRTAIANATKPSPSAHPRHQKH